jgi:teichuronic acid biosynthesis glycosyltransferase TuaG
MRYDDKLISVIMPAHNAAGHISETIDSLLAQTYENWELIVIDDRSTDDTHDFLNRLQSRFPDKVRVHLNEHNLGAGGSRNVALAMARGRYVAFLDSDDLWEPNKLKIQLEQMVKEGAALSHTSYRFIDEQSNLLRGEVTALFRLDLPQYLKTTNIGLLTAMVDREKVGETLYFNKNVEVIEDSDLWIRILKLGHNSVGIPEVLASYRIRKNQRSGNKLRAAIRLYKTYAMHSEIGFQRRFYYFAYYAFNGVRKRVFRV